MRLHTLVVAAVLTGVACHRPAPQAAGPAVVTITATDYTFGGPDTIPAGLTTFRLINQGKELHHASLVRLGAGKTVAAFQTGLQAAMQSHAPPPPWMAFVGGPNAVTLGDTGVATQVLEPGSYVFVCWIPTLEGVPHVLKGMIRPLVVTAAAAPPAAEPAADLTIKLTDYDFQLSQPLTAGKHVVRVENTGAQAHEVVIAALSSGKTLRDFIAWEQGGEKGPLPTGRWLGGVTTLDVGGHGEFTTTFAPGNYLLLCFWPDAKDGKPHLMHGMGKQVTVS
jgi:plastocyanin